MREIKFREDIEYTITHSPSNGKMIDGYVYCIKTKKPKHKDAKGWYKRQGYIMRLVEGHPNADKRGYVPEHRLIMEKHLGRFLKSEEKIHHRNQNREDNSFDNLELFGNQAKHAESHLVGKRNPHGQFIADEPIFSELKFRLYNKNTKTTYIYTLATLIGTTFRRGQFEFRGRWTGLKDKNGKEIYEGDILRQHKNKGTMFKVFWHKDGSFLVEEIDEPSIWNSLWAWAKVTEIIGNIYENPELLK